jgi:hypothetical protein
MSRNPGRVSTPASVIAAQAAVLNPLETALGLMEAPRNPGRFTQQLLPRSNPRPAGMPRGGSGPRVTWSAAKPGAPNRAALASARSASHSARGHRSSQRSDTYRSTRTRSGLPWLLGGLRTPSHHQPRRPRGAPLRRWPGTTHEQHQDDVVHGDRASLGQVARAEPQLLQHLHRATGVAVCGCPRRASERCHALRHFYAGTALHEGEAIKAMSEYLGHADPGFTLRTYTHLMEETQSAPSGRWTRRFVQVHRPMRPRLEKSHRDGLATFSPSRIAETEATAFVPESGDNRCRG